jgi:hypothetical protein
MKEYLVVWKINMPAESAEEAAQRAAAVQRDPRSLATIYNVTPYCSDCRDYHIEDEQIIDLQREAIDRDQ